jgi:hypothetical protein
MNPTLPAIATFVVAALFAPLALAGEATIRKNIPERVPNFPKIDEVTKTAIPGLYELRVLDTEIYYTDEQGNYVIQGGKLIDLQTRANVTEQRIADRKHLLKSGYFVMRSISRISAAKTRSYCSPGSPSDRSARLLVLM